MFKEPHPNRHGFRTAQTCTNHLRACDPRPAFLITHPIASGWTTGSPLHVGSDRAEGRCDQGCTLFLVQARFAYLWLEWASFGSLIGFGWFWLAGCCNSQLCHSCNCQRREVPERSWKKNFQTLAHFLCICVSFRWVSPCPSQLYNLTLIEFMVELRWQWNTLEVEATSLSLRQYRRLPLNFWDHVTSLMVADLFQPRTRILKTCRRHECTEVHLTQQNFRATHDSSRQ